MYIITCAHIHIYKHVHTCKTMSQKSSLFSFPKLFSKLKNKEMNPLPWSSFSLTPLVTFFFLLFLRNTLPSDISRASFLSAFKSGLKCHLVNKLTLTTELTVALLSCAPLYSLYNPLLYFSPLHLPHLILYKMHINFIIVYHPN